MKHIQSSNLCQPTFVNKAIARGICVLTVGAIALFLIGLTASKTGPFNVITQLGTGNNSILLGTSLFLFILDFVWIANIKKKNFIPKPMFRKEISSPIDKQILSYLSPKDLAVSSRINKSWKESTSLESLWNKFNLVNLFPKLTITDECFWQHAAFASFRQNVDNIKPINGHDKRAMIPVIQKLLPLVEGGLGVTILTIPKGLTFNHLVSFAESLVGEHGTIFRYIWQNFRDKYGNVSIPETYRVILTNNVLKDTRYKSAQAQKDLIDKLGIGCDFPEVIDMVTLLISTLFNTNNRLFNDSPCTFSRCREIIDNLQMHVGAFMASSGFGVVSDIYDNKYDGLAGRRKFLVTQT